MYSKTSEVKKRMQKIRMMSYFIEATQKIIEEQGFENVTIRKVSDIAGYNSATIYNYFENLEHLVFFASMKYLREYSRNLSSYTKGARNSLEKYLNIWSAFCKYSFERPQVFYTIFFDKFSSSLPDIVEQYYEIFSEELGEHKDSTLLMLQKKNIYARNKAILEDCVSEGYIRADDIDAINEMSMLIYQSLLSRVVDGQVSYSPDEASKKTLEYLKRVLISYQVDNTVSKAFEN